MPSVAIGHRKENQLARLDKITADEWKRKQRWQQVQRDTHDHTDQNFASSKEHFFQIEPTNQMNDSMSMEEEVEEQENMEVANNSGRFTFDDADSDGESSQRYNITLPCMIAGSTVEILQ